MNNLSLTQNSVLCGLMLGDGCLVRRTLTSNPYLSINHKLEDKEYVYWLYNFFVNLCNNEPAIKNWIDNRPNFNQEFEQSWFITKCLPTFVSAYERWYPNGQKIIPPDFNIEELNELTLTTWFLDDGSCYYNKKYPRSLQIRLYTNGFSKSDVERLRFILSKKLNELFTIGTDKKHPDQFIIIGADAAARAYFHFIDKITPEEMVRKYKWRDEVCQFYIDKKFIKSKRSRNQFIFENEYHMLKSFYDKGRLTIPEISNICNWKRNSIYNTVPTTQISRYLKCYENNFLIKKTDTFIFHEGRIYEMTECGKRYFENYLKNKDINDLLYNYLPLAKSKHGPK